MIPYRDRLPESARIKIGGYSNETYTGRNKKTYRKLSKWDHFKITLPEREEDKRFSPDQQNFIIDEEMTKKLAHKSQKNKSKPKKIGPIFLPFDLIDANFYTTYAYYTASRPICIGDGNCARRLTKKGQSGLLKISDPDATEEIDCIPNACPFYNERFCRASGVLSVVSPHANFGSLIVFRTKSRNSIESILTYLMIACAQRGSLVGIPFNLVLNEKRQMDGTGQMRKVRYVSIEYDGTYEEFMSLPPRKVAQQIDMKNEVLVRQKQLQIRSAKLLEEPEDFYDEEGEGTETDTKDDGKAQCIACSGSGKSSKGEQCIPCGGSGRVDKKEKEGKNDKAQKPKSDPKPEPKPDAKEKATAKPKEEAPAPAPEPDPKPAEEPQPPAPAEDNEPLDKGDFIARDWKITHEIDHKPVMDLPKAKYIIDAVDALIRAKGRKFTNESLAKYGVTIATLNDIAQEPADELVGKVREARAAKMSDEEKRLQKIAEEVEALANTVAEHMDEYVEIIHPGEIPILRDTAAEQTVQRLIEREIEYPAGLTELKPHQLKTLDKKLLKEIQKELKEKAEREKAKAEAEEANKKKQEEDAKRQAEEDANGGDDFTLF